MYSITHKNNYNIADIGRKKQALFLILPDEKTTYYPIYAGDTIHLPGAPSTGVSGTSGQANEITGMAGEEVTTKKRQNIPDDAPDWLFDDSDIQPSAQKKPNTNAGGTAAPTPNYNYTPYNPISNPDYERYPIRKKCVRPLGAG